MKKSKKKSNGCFSVLLSIVFAGCAVGGLYMKFRVSNDSLAKYLFIAAGVFLFLLIMSSVSGKKKITPQKKNQISNGNRNRSRSGEYDETLQRAIVYYEQYYGCSSCGERLLQSNTNEFDKYDVVFRCSSCGKYEAFYYRELMDIYKKRR